MKAVISSTYDDQYFFFLPIVTWCWNKLGVDVICFLPSKDTAVYDKRIADLVFLSHKVGLRYKTYYFEGPLDKQPTYAQCSRLYAAALDLPEEEMLIVSDIDMALFQIPHHYDGRMSVFGNDLVPVGQVPMCYLSGPVKEWRRRFEINDRSYQQMLDALLGDIECDNMRGNYWSKDQQEARDKILGGTEHAMLIPRARPGTQFAENRLDRDDSFFMDRLSPDIIDYHMHRPGYTDENFEKIISVIQYFYPSDDLTWMRKYHLEYKKLL